MHSEEPVMITLQCPIEGPDGQTIEEIEVKRPKGHELWQLHKMNMASPTYRDFVEVVSVCQHLPLSTVKKMDGADIMAIGDALMTFLASSLLTGNKSG